MIDSMPDYWLDSLFSSSFYSNMWWDQATLYQIYIRSFHDSNGDGIGDLNGIKDKLSYIKDLGVDGIWITPFFESPGKDFGYDISDYRKIDPVFGDLKNFKDLISSTHDCDLKLIIDQAFSHTSDQHEWFQKSRRREPGYEDYYIWCDEVPNNWQSIFGGNAWEFDELRGQYYMHNFLKEQPDLNFHNSKVQAEILDIMKYWLDLGVDGFRLDVCNFYFHSQDLEDNPPRPKNTKPTGGSILDSPYQHQLHIFDKDRPENLEFLKKLRNLADQYQDIFLMAEIASDNQPDVVKQYTDPGLLHSAYSFELLVDNYYPGMIDEKVSEIFSDNENRIPSWSLSNHDVVRVATRFANNDSELAKDFMQKLLSLKGVVILYQGEELGFTESDLKYEDLVDPYGLAFYPKFKGRDGCRTPIAWNDKDKPMWLPIDPNHLENNVEKQTLDPDSFLNFTKDLIRQRKIR